MNLAQLLQQQAIERPESVALVEGCRRITFAELEAQSGKLAAGLRSRGLSPGDNVLLGYPMGISLYCNLFALWKCGACAVFIDPTLSPENLRACLQRLGHPPLLGGLLARIGRLRRPALRRLTFWSPRRGQTPLPPAELPDEAAALLTFTSGSTGIPKGIVRSHGFLREQHSILLPLLDLRAGESTLATLPVFALANLASGMTTVIAPGLLRGPGRVKARKVLRILRREKPVSITAAPAFYERLIEAGATLPGVRHAFVGGAAVFPSFLRRLQALLPDGEAVAVYGSSEAEPIAEFPFSKLTAENLAAVRAGGGIPAGPPDSSIRLRLEDGEILVAGPQVLTGYLDGVGDAENKLREGDCIWHRTGDAGRIDDDGNLWLLGRCSARQGDLHPFTVEAAAVEHASLRRAGLVRAGEGLWLAVEAWRGEVVNSSAMDALCRDFGLQGWRKLRLPVDARHQSKVDYKTLARTMETMIRC